MNRAERRLQRKKTEKAAKNVKSVRLASPSPGQQVLTIEQQTLTIQQSLELAVQHHTQGRLAEAEGIYQQILQGDRLIGVGFQYLLIDALSLRQAALSMVPQGEVYGFLND